MHERDDALLPASTQTQEASTPTLSGEHPGHLSVAIPVEDTSPGVSTKKHSTAHASWTGWYGAFKKVLSVYLVIHLAFYALTCLSVLFILKDFSSQSMSLSTVWQAWLQWDTINFRAIAVHGYTTFRLTTFFPLYPLLVRCVMLLIHDPLLAGLLISNLSGLGLLVVLYRLVQEDFNAEHAFRTVLYLSVFPTAFFFAAAYSESLFLFLTVLSFYHMRHSHWWLAGLFGFLASLTRSTGLLLILPFCYEYLRQHNDPAGTRFCGVKKILPMLKAMRFDVLSGLLIPAGLVLFALYCYFRFHDPLAFVHAQVFWGRKLSIPGYAILRSIKAISISRGLLSFQALRNILDLGAVLFVSVLVILGLVGPWKFPRSLWMYAIFATACYLFPQFVPFGGLYPLVSMPRFILSVFPAFIVLAAIGKNRTLDMSYLIISCCLLFFLLIQFLTGHWIT